MEFGHESTTPTGVLRIHSSFDSNNVKKLRSSLSSKSNSSSSSSSSSPDSPPFDDLFKDKEDDEYETNNKYNTDTNTDTDTSTSAKHFEEYPPPQLASNYSSGSSIPKDEQHNFDFPAASTLISPTVASDPPPPPPQLSLHNTSTTESPPPIQSMEKRSEEDSTKNRILEYVFSRTKSTAPVEWSVASNESLFSIHMENMSFSKDMLWRSGELGFPGETTTSPQISPNFTTPLKLNTTTTTDDDDTCKSSEGNVADEAVETTKEVIIKESAEDKSNEKISLAFSVSSRSDTSGASVKSFAFPILTGDYGKGNSAKITSSPRVGLEHPHPQMQTQTQLELELESKQEPQSQPQLQPQESQPKPNSLSQPSNTQTRWFGCFTCCSFCS